VAILPYSLTLNDFCIVGNTNGQNSSEQNQLNGRQFSSRKLTFDISSVPKHFYVFISDTKNSRPEKSSVNILTHCNTGSLATGGYGTALGVIRALKDLGHLSKAYCTETRPYNQGSRLTAYELVYEKIPSKLICDSAVSALMATKVGISQCGNFSIILSHRFFVKSILENVKVLKLLGLLFQGP